MKKMKKIAWLLCFLLIVCTVMENSHLRATAQGEGTTFAFNITDDTDFNGNGVQYKLGSGDWMSVSSGDVIDISESSQIFVKAERTDPNVKVDCSGSAGFASDINFDGIAGESGAAFDLAEGVSYVLNVHFLDQNTGDNLTFFYDDTGLGWGEIQWQDAENNWHTQQGDGTVSAVAVRIVYSNEGVLANHTELRVDGEAMLAESKAALESEGGLPLDPNKNYTFEHIQFVGSSNGGGGDNPPVEFDGIAYFVWQGADDALCVHKITGLDESRSQGEEIAFDIIYIPVSGVKDDTTGEPFIIGNENYFWVWGSKEDFIANNSSSFGEFLTAVENIRDYDEKRSILIDPCGAIDGESTVCTNGDRVFRATIYNDTTFEGIAFSQNQDDYTYFPSFWDNVFFTNTLDISETTPENPAIYEAFILEPMIHFGKAVNSVNDITGIRALNVPEGAVTITGDEASGFSIQFGSNFFDSVVFEVTTAGGSYYLEIVRTAMKTFHVGGPDDERIKMVAEVYYDSQYSYTDYEVYATIHYADGSISLQKVEASEIEDDGFGNPMPAGIFEMEGGVGLLRAQYGLTLSEDMVGIDFNAVKKGAFSSTTYGGSYFGSGNGVYVEVR